MKKNKKKFAAIEKLRTFATAKPKGVASLGYGVMVTLQILVLSFLVRIQVAQLTEGKPLEKAASLFSFSYLYLLGGEIIRIFASVNY